MAKTRIITREMIEKYIDGQLDLEGIRLVRRAMDANPEIKAYVEQMCETMNILQSSLIDDLERKNIQTDELDDETVYTICRMLQGNMDQKDTTRIENISAAAKLDNVIESIRSVQALETDFPPAPRELLDRIVPRASEPPVVMTENAGRVSFATADTFSRSVVVGDGTYTLRMRFSPTAGPAARIAMTLSNGGAPAATMSVLLIRNESGKHFSRTYTDKDGNALLGRVPPGSFGLEVRGTKIRFDLEIT